MDMSRKYIEMCSKATEIQELRKVDGEGLRYEWGDVIFTNELDVRIVSFGKIDPRLNYDNKIVINKEDISYDSSVEVQKIVWLPRQDQLDSIATYSNPFENVKFGFMETIYSKFFKYCELNTKNHGLKTFEKQWLSFIMKENFGKEWNEDKKDWIKL
jgi:hypothetical protein